MTSTPRPSSSATLLFGFDPRTALAVARPLHRAGIRVWVATVASWEMPITSRAIAGYIDLSRWPADALHSALLAAMQTHGCDTLIPITDRALALLSPHFEYLAARVKIAGPTPDQLAVILDKTATASLAEKYSVPVPRRIDCSDADRAGAAFPLFAKPNHKSQAEGNDPLRPSAWFIPDRAALHEWVLERRQPDTLVQEYISGDDVGLAVLMHQGKARLSFQYRAERLFPAQGGVTVLARTEAVDPALFACAERMLAALHWRGLAQVDFRHDRVTGKFALLEINGRFWGSAAVAQIAGVNFALAVVRQLRGEVLPAQTTYRCGVQVRWLEGDFRRLLRIWQEAQNPPQRALARREAVKFLAAFRPGIRGMVWSWRDPLAGLDMLRKFFWYWSLARAKSVRRKIVPASTDGAGVAPTPESAPLEVETIKVSPR